jgi:alkanesulfonate monooxygenase SsuD/methylene tetrahydromethanopterin reductase-like flavin-dependent oxidoreductase (luciferase family)
MIRFGISPHLQPLSGSSAAQRWQEALLEARIAEECGFDLALFSGRPAGLQGSPLLAAAGLSTVSGGIELGVVDLVCEPQTALRLAADARYLGAMAGGRLTLGLIPPGRLDQEGPHSIAFGEALVTLQLALDGSYVEEGGAQARGELLALAAASTREGVVRAASLADGWICLPNSPLATLIEWGVLYRETCAREGRRPNVVVLQGCYCALTRRAAEAVLALTPLSGERWILGTPQDCIEQIECYVEELGATGLVVRMGRPASASPGEALESIQLFGEQVIPYFRARYGDLARLQNVVGSS